MMRYSLRTLIVLLLILPPLGAWSWREYQACRKRQRIQDLGGGVLMVWDDAGIVLIEQLDLPPQATSSSASRVEPAAK